MQRNLFDSTQNNNDAPHKPVQIKNSNIPLSKEQQAFNRLSKRIEKLQKQISDETDKLEHLNSLYQKDVHPHILELGRLKIEICHLLNKKRTDIKLSRTQNQKLDTLLLDFLNDAFSVIEPTDETKELYKKYSGLNYEEELSRQESAMKEDFSAMLYEEFGLQIDPSILTENPDFDKIEEELKKQWEQKESEKGAKPKTKKQLEKEKLEQQKEALKNKSIRSIYIALAKILHPDTEPDEILKIEKEEMMKKVTVAYENKDLMQLLQLEMQWIKGHDENFNNMPSATLNVYIQLLKDQVKELDEELHMLHLNPIFSAVQAFSHLSKSIAPLELIREGVNYRALNKKIQSDIHQLMHSHKTQVAVTQFIKDFYIDPKETFFYEL
ncbi:hypothetical protein SAMN05518672_105383 [Chitinophaga sp. CF118]|nr:hypothetical protein SAMN05518672_105383 [Chitinophaga sp. CF118]